MFKVNIEIPDQLVADVLCAGMEGGIGYWSKITGYSEPTRFAFRFDKDHMYKHIDYPMNEGGIVFLQDLEDNDRVLSLTKSKLQKALILMAYKYPSHFADIVRENSDAATGDALIQLALFDNIIYG